MHLLSIFNLFFLSFSIQHSAVHQAWYTSRVGPLIQLPVAKGKEKEKKPHAETPAFIFLFFILLLSIYFPHKSELFHNETCCKFH